MSSFSTWSDRRAEKCQQTDFHDAERLLKVINESHGQAARAYLSTHEPKMATRSNLLFPCRSVHNDDGAISLCLHRGLADYAAYGEVPAIEWESGERFRLRNDSRKNGAAAGS